MKISIHEDAAPSSLDDVVTYRAIIEGAPVMLWLGDETGKCLFLNREQRDFWGVDPDDLSQFDWAGTLHPDDIEGLSVPFQDAMAAQRGFVAEARYRRADGEYRILNTRARPRFSASGKFLGMVGVNTDITDRRIAEDQLRRSTDQLELALDSSQGIGTWIWDIEAGVITVDTRFAEVFGIDPSDAERGLPPQDFLDAITDEDRDRVLEAFNAAMKSSGQFQCEYHLKPRPGMPAFVLAMGGAERDLTGRTRRLAGIAVDITERKARENQLSLLTRELSHRIKNIFSIVTSLTSMAAREDPEAALALHKLRDRFAAMGAAYSLILQGEHGEGCVAGGLCGLVEQLLAPYQDDSEKRVRIACEDVALRSQGASSLALILHELATNSVKYGALSAEGQVLVEGGPDGDGHYVLSWRESGGPELAGEPRSSGFGTSLIAMSAMNLNAQVDAVWDRAGLQWSLTVGLGDL